MAKPGEHCMAKPGGHCMAKPPGAGRGGCRGGALSSAGMDVTLIVDGANVMGSRADGWWRDRAGAMARLHGELAALAARGIAGPVPGEAAGSAGEPAAAGEAGAAAEPGGRWFPRIVLVVEGRARAVLDLVEPDPGVRVVAARGEGDDEIADLAPRPRRGGGAHGPARGQPPGQVRDLVVPFPGGCPRGGSWSPPTGSCGGAA